MEHLAPHLNLKLLSQVFFAFACQETLLVCSPNLTSFQECSKPASLLKVKLKSRKFANFLFAARVGAVKARVVQRTMFERSFLYSHGNGGHEFLFALKAYEKMQTPRKGFKFEAGVSIFKLV